MDVKGFQLKLEAQSRLFTYHPIYAVVLGSVDAAVLLEYLLGVADGRHMFAAAEADVRAETGMSASALRSARNALVEKSVIGFSMVKKKPTYAIYAVIFDSLLENLISEGEKLLEKKDTKPVADVQAEAPVEEPPTEAAAGGMDAMFSAFMDTTLSMFKEGEAQAVKFSIPGGLVPPKIPATVDPDTSHYHLAVALCKVCGLDEKLNIGKGIGVVKLLMKATVKPTLRLIEFQYGDPRGWWRNVDFRGRKGQLPTLWQIESTWGSWGGTFIPPEEVDVTIEAARLMAYGTPGLPDMP